MLWQLKKLSTGEALNEPQRLPENWGPIFGMGGIKDRLGDLSWLGDAYADQGWVEAGEEAPVPTTATDVNETIAYLLRDTAWAVAEDDMTVTRGQRADWITYRQELRNIPLQVGFPTDVTWPSKPA
jgi:hypothetical protein